LNFLRRSLLRHSTVNWTSSQSATCLAKSLKRLSAPAIATYWPLHLRISLPDLSHFCNPSCYCTCERSLTRFVRDRRRIKQCLICLIIISSCFSVCYSF